MQNAGFGHLYRFIHLVLDNSVYLKFKSNDESLHSKSDFEVNSVYCIYYNVYSLLKCNFNSSLKKKMYLRT